MKVIFLDVDGVLNSDEYIEKTQKLNIQGIEREVDPEKITLLKNAIIETGAKVVLSSSWRHTKNGKYLKQLLGEYGIFTDSTPFLNHERGKEIKQWLINHPDAEDFIILDDEIFDSYDGELMKKLIKISNGNGKGLGEGLKKKDVEQIIEKLGRKNKEEELEI